MPGLNILLVDDEADIRRIASLSLEKVGGHRVRTSANGTDALEALQEHRPDVVLLDVMMPGLDGPSTLRALREHPALVDLAVIFLTAKIKPDEVGELRKLGALGVISKPFNPMTLAQEVEAVLAA